MKDTAKIETGKEGEKIAAAYLRKNGYHIYESNFRCSLGEIDIIAREKNELVFIEVKTRKSGKLGYPEQAVGARKQKKCRNWLCGICKKRNLPTSVPAST
jgi:putative endonuclease